mmetsp:Transcript_10588/g.15502  ORF Transcript_10588/g.15502 Transcript_10588/m.15502 type:complete len:126 (-) Transcript_10588:124-501(-)
MKVFARTPAKTIVLNINGNESVEALKQQIFNAEGIAPEFQSLTFQGKILDGELSAYEIAENETIGCSLRLLGGVIEPSLQALARKYNCEKQICRDCYARLPPKAKNCRKKKCGHSSNLRIKKKIR